MRFNLMGLMAFVCLASACSQKPADTAMASINGGRGPDAAPARGVPIVPQRKGAHRIADAADRGALLAFEAGTKPIHAGESTWHAVEISEGHALQAIGGELTLPSPNGGAPITLKYDRHVEHEDGNWTWMGRSHKDGPVDAVITFGARAIFGRIPSNDGTAPMKLSMARGKVWLVESPNESGLNVDDDFVAANDVVRSAVPASSSAKSTRVAASAPTTQAAASATNTVDVVVGYTTGFAQRLGGTSQATTRLNFLFDLANTAYTNSQLDAGVRMVYSTMVDYPDATTNRSALFALSGLQCAGGPGGELPDGGGVTCDPGTRPLALETLVTAKRHYGADLISLVRKFEFPENASCGLAWVLGWGQSTIDASSADMGLSVISDSSGAMFPDEGNSCRDDTFVHELGHNMGQVHDRVSAAASDDPDGDGNLLDPEEFGRHPYSFGFTGDSSNGNFYTVMSPRVGNRTGNLVFSTPALSVCGSGATPNLPCGVADQADNVRSMRITVPIVAAFGQPPVAGPIVRNPSSDVSADGKSDIVWYHSPTQTLAYWVMDGANVPTSGGQVLGGEFRALATGDFNGDGRADVVARGPNNDLRVFLATGGAFVGSFVAAYPSGWEVIGSGDVSGDGKADIVWYHAPTRTLAYWVMDGAMVARSGGQVLTGDYVALNTGDYNGDGLADVLARGPTGDLRVYIGNSSTFTGTTVAGYPSGWEVVGSGDVDGDNKSDVVWYHAPTRTLAYWIMNGTTVVRTNGMLLTGDYTALSVGDFNGDHKADVLSRGPGGDLRLWTGDGNLFTGANVAGYPSGWKIVGTRTKKPALDVDNDGRSDLAWFHEPSNTLGYWIMNSAGVTRTGGQEIDGAALGAADFNGDGIVDVLARGPGGVLRVWTGNGSVFAGANLTGYPTGWTFAGSNDVDNDQKADAIWFHAPSSTVGYWIMNGASVTRSGGQELEAGATLLTVGDYNGDGLADLVTRNTAGAMRMWIGNGSVFTSVAMGNYPTGWTLLGSSDIDNDGRSDLVFFHAPSTALGYWIMNGPTMTRSGGQSLGAGQVALTVGDYNGDGLSDVYSRNGAGTLVFWRGNGSVFTATTSTGAPAGWSVLR